VNSVELRITSWVIKQHDGIEILQAFAIDTKG
jgi:hypothetical protein